MDFSSSTDSKNTGTSKSHIDEGLLDIAIEDGRDLITASKTKNFAQKEKFLHERNRKWGKPMHIDESNAS
jgi:hypothetical protein